MDIGMVRTLYDYNVWAHHQVWDCIMQLNDEQFTREIEYSHGSIHAQVVHTMFAEWSWFSRLQGHSTTRIWQAADFPTRDSIRARWDEVEADIRAYLDSLSDEDLKETFHYTTTKGTPQENVRWEILIHVLNHGTDHRAQIMAMLNQIGVPGVEQDLIFYLRGR